MILEKPIIVSNAGALPELIDNNKSGLIVDPFNKNEWASAIISLLENPTKANKFATEAKKKAEKEFSINSYINNYKSLYEKLKA